MPSRRRERFSQVEKEGGARKEGRRGTGQDGKAGGREGNISTETHTRVCVYFIDNKQIVYRFLPFIVPFCKIGRPGERFRDCTNAIDT